MGAIAQMLARLEDENLLAEVRKQLDEGVDPLAIFKECQEGMVAVGDKFSSGEYFVSDLMMAGSIFKQVNEMVIPLLGEEKAEKVGKVVMGTVKGDIHDIGKDLVVALLNAANFEVVDLGVDVKPEAFVEALKANPDAKVVGLSCLLTTCYDAMKETVEAIAEAGLRDKVKIMIGGGSLDQSVVDYAGADKFGMDAQAAVTIAKEWM